MKQPKPPRPPRPPKKLPLWGKILLVVVIVLAALAGLATLYVNGKLDLLHYNDGSVDSMGTIDADENGAWTGPVWYIATTR